MVHSGGCFSTDGTVWATSCYTLTSQGMWNISCLGSAMKNDGHLVLDYSVIGTELYMYKHRLHRKNELDIRGLQSYLKWKIKIEQQICTNKGTARAFDKFITVYGIPNHMFQARWNIKAETKWPTISRRHFKSPSSINFVAARFFHWNGFQMAHFTIIRYWFREWLGIKQAKRHCLNQQWPCFGDIYVLHSVSMIEMAEGRFFWLSKVMLWAGPKYQLNNPMYRIQKMPQIMTWTVVSRSFSWCLTAK